MRRTATDLRAHLYQVLDEVAKTGEPVEILRNGVTLNIVRVESRAAKRIKTPKIIPNLIVGDPDDLVHMEWPSTE